MGVSRLIFLTPFKPFLYTPSQYLPFFYDSMSFRSGKPIRRYVLVLFILALFVYYSGTHLGRNSAYIRGSSFDKHDGSTYVRPKEHEVNQQDEFMEIDHDLLKQRERQVMRRQIDQKYCGRDHCRFMLPIAITEQGAFSNNFVAIVI